MTTASTTDLALMAHLLRRAGFGTDRDELERYSEKSYEDVVEDLLNLSARRRTYSRDPSGHHHRVHCVAKRDRPAGDDALRTTQFAQCFCLDRRL